MYHDETLQMMIRCWNYIEYLPHLKEFAYFVMLFVGIIASEAIISTSVKIQGNSNPVSSCPKYNITTNFSLHFNSNNALIFMDSSLKPKSGYELHLINGFQTALTTHPDSGHSSLFNLHSTSSTQSDAAHSSMNNPPLTSSTLSDFVDSTRRPQSSSVILLDTGFSPVNHLYFSTSIHTDNIRKRIKQGRRLYNESLNRKFIKIPKLDRENK